MTKTDIVDLLIWFNGSDIYRTYESLADQYIASHPSEKETENLKMYENMQYYMEYCEQIGYVTPQDWIEKHKHF